MTHSGEIFAFSTLGSGSNEEARILALLERFEPTAIPFDRRAKLRSFFRVLRTLWRHRPKLVVMEGTGLAGGAAVLLARLLAGVRFVVSSGDAVGPWVASRTRLAGPFFHAFERALCRCAAGFIGWTPYLTGRALTFGVRRAMTAPGFAPFPRTREALAAGRQRIRSELGIPESALVFGLVGSLEWNPRVEYAYGLELVRARLQAKRPEVVVLVVGDGTGLDRLRALAGERLGREVHLPGRVPQDRVPDYLAAMDVASLPQSVDQVGSFRYTTKLSEYLAAGVPVATGEIPLAYDLDEGWLWRLPGETPWSERYVEGLARLMERLGPGELEERREAARARMPEFDLERQVRRTTAFVEDLLASSTP